MNRRFPLSAIAIATALLSPISNADGNEIERIVVTSGFQDVTLEQLSASASVIDAQTLTQRQAVHVEDILGLIPNVNFTTGASRGRFVQIRGIGERSQFAEPINPSVNLYVDAFDFSGLGAAALTFDTQQVEVFRGPQATLFGGGALAGAVNIHSRRAGEDSQNYIYTQAATDNAWLFEGGYSFVVSDAVSARVAGIRNKADGFINNTFLNRDDTNNIDETAAKLDVNVALDDKTQIDLQYRWYDIDNGYDAFSLDNDRNTRSDEPGFDRQKTHAVSLELNKTLEVGQLYVAATHAAHDIGYGYDEDWTFTGFHPFGYTSTDFYFRDIDTQTFEARLSSADNYAWFNGKTDWTLGVFGKRVSEELSREYTFASDFNSEFRPETLAAFLQTETELADNWRLDAGIRVERFSFDYMHNEGVDVDTSNTVLGGKVALNYIQDDHIYYASVSRGYKAAGVNPDQQVSEAQRFFDTEYNWNYEVGVKSFLLDNTLTSRLAIFHMRRRDTQISDFDVQTRDDGTSEFIDIIENADLGINEGVELELTWQATDAWKLTTNVGYLNAYFEGYTRRNGEFIAKREQAQAPRWTAFVASDYQLSDAWSFNVNADFRTSHFFSDGHNEQSPFTAIVNSNIVLREDTWEFSIWARNILDREYFTRGFGGFSNDPRDEYAFNEPYFQLGNPRQVGISWRYMFN
jgi:outer membrane receptor protein involved in Fe transport